ncbi:hypothetical protein [Aeromicrobium terrae]|uniref:Uncharacterized protein n=1 Tax=Aeromicrobium terrae TaxID=2498846 RepID=A0A5C8NIK8_9ACTN|nr:hypothetical protein [Aeromicrobium terrae]TXL60847.1 hypothetical protein FHP06_10515 [Aeromicrobium terrae]
MTASGDEDSNRFDEYLDEAMQDLVAQELEWAQDVEKRRRGLRVRQLAAVSVALFATGLSAVTAAVGSGSDFATANLPWAALLGTAVSTLAVLAGSTALSRVAGRQVRATEDRTLDMQARRQLSDLQLHVAHQQRQLARATRFTRGGLT